MHLIKCVINDEAKILRDICTYMWILHRRQVKHASKTISINRAIKGLSVMSKMAKLQMPYTPMKKGAARMTATAAFSQIQRLFATSNV